MKSGKNVKNNVETQGVARDHQWKNSQYNWDARFDHIMLSDRGVDVVYLDEEDGWMQWNLAVRLQNNTFEL